MDDLLSIVLSNAVAAAVLALLAAITGAVCRRPALMHGLWLLVLLKLVTPPLVRIPIVWPTAAESSRVDVAPATAEEPPPETTPPLEHPAVAFILTTTAEDEPAASTDVPIAPPSPVRVDPPLWPRVLPLVWLAGSLGWFVLAVVRLGRFRRLLRFARRAPAALQERAARLAHRLDLSRCPRVELLPGRIAPMLWVVGGSPRLLVPADLLDALSDEQLDTLLVHELAHLRRRDHWVRALEFAVMGLYWWHPVVWYARRELREAEEQCCDAWVVSTLPGAGRTYATALIDTLDFLSTARPAVPPLASGIGHVHDLKRRLTMIMRGTTPRALSWPGCLSMLALGAFFLPLLPALQAQEPNKDEVKKKAIVLELREKAAQSQADVAAAEAALKVAEAELQAHKAMVAQAQARLKAAIAQTHAQQGKKVEELQSRLQGELKKAIIVHEQALRTVGDKKKAAIHIEIFVDGGINVMDLSKKLAGILPEKARIQIVESTTEGKMGDVIRKQGMQLRIEPKPLPSKATLHLKVPQPQEQRINDLEKKLEKVLQELHELRKQMKEPRSGFRSGLTPAGRLTPAGDLVVPSVQFQFEVADPPSPPKAPKPR